MLIVGDQAEGDSTATLDIGNYPAVHSANRLEVGTEDGNFQTQGIRPFRKYFDAERAT